MAGTGGEGHLTVRDVAALLKAPWSGAEGLATLDQPANTVGTGEGSQLGHRGGTGAGDGAEGGSGSGTVEEQGGLLREAQEAQSEPLGQGAGVGLVQGGGAGLVQGTGQGAGTGQCAGTGQGAGARLSQGKGWGSSSAPDTAQAHSAAAAAARWQVSQASHPSTETSTGPVLQ